MIIRQIYQSVSPHGIYTAPDFYMVEHQYFSGGGKGSAKVALFS